MTYFFPFRAPDVGTSNPLSISRVGPKRPSKLNAIVNRQCFLLSLDLVLGRAPFAFRQGLIFRKRIKKRGRFYGEVSKYLINEGVIFNPNFSTSPSRPLSFSHFFLLALAFSITHIINIIITSSIAFYHAAVGVSNSSGRARRRPSFTCVGTYKHKI